MKYAGFLAFLFLFMSSPTHAQTMNSETDSIQGKIVKPNEPIPTTSQEEIVLPLSPVEQNKVQIGYGYPTKNKTIAMSFKTPYIDWEHLTPTEPSIRQSTLALFPQASNFLGVYVFQNHELTSTDPPATIPDTTCDDGSCDDFVASLWTNHLTYGVGFRCDSLDRICEKGFAQNQYFKQFPSRAQNENPTLIMQSGTHDTTATIRYKVNISGTQKEGVYAHEVIFITAPSY